MRLLWLRVHRWFGLTLLIVFLVLGVTGMSLVWRDATEQLIHPDRFPAHVTTTPTSPSTLWAAGVAALPVESRVTQLIWTGPGQAVVATGEHNAPPILGIGPPRRPRAWLDPADASLLSQSRGGPDFVYVAKAIHGHMLIAGFGRWVMALAGFGLMISAGTGLWLWWPGVAKIRTAMRWHSALPRSMNLHRQLGPVAAIGLVVQGATGIFMALPWLLGPAASAPVRPAQLVASRPIAKPVQSIDLVAAAARREGGGARIASITLPTEEKAKWTVALVGGKTMIIDDADGSVAIKPRSPAASTSAAAGWIAALHEGSFGILHQILLFATGAALSTLAFTGLLLWGRGRGRRPAKRA